MMRTISWESSSTSSEAVERSPNKWNLQHNELPGRLVSVAVCYSVTARSHLFIICTSRQCCEQMSASILLAHNSPAVYRKRVRYTIYTSFCTSL